MKNLIRFIRSLFGGLVPPKAAYFFLMFCLLTSASLLHAQWVQTNGPYGASVNCLVISQMNLFAGTGDGVFLSTNNGTSWTAVDFGLTNYRVMSLAVSGTNLFAGTFDGRVFLSTNNGTSWTRVNSGFAPDLITLAVSGTNLFAGTVHYGVILSTNNGTSWTAVDSGLTNIFSVNALAVSGANLFAGSGQIPGGGVFLSTNNGTSWTAVDSGLTYSSVYSLVVSGTNLFAGTYGGGVFLSTNNGTSWTAVDSGLTYSSVYSLVVSGTNLFAGTYGGGVFLSTNNGTSWTAVDSGLTDSVVASLAVSGANLFAGTYSSGVWRRPLSEMVTQVKHVNNQVASYYALEQNYPNPFNPTTTIGYQLPIESHVTLKVYDVLGSEVGTLVNERQNAGPHAIRFNASNLPSGVYFYRLEAGTYHDTKKLLLLK